MTTPEKKQFTHIPQHVAIIMDGNRRWAEQRGLPKITGHQAGVKSLRRVIERLGFYRIPVVTIYGFSTENWKRSRSEVQGLLLLLEEVLRKEIDEIHDKGIKLQHIGRLEELPPSAQDIINDSVRRTKNNINMILNFAFNYGGRLEILDAFNRIISTGAISHPIDEKLLSGHLYTAGLPDVDLVIRTGGETRLSNFLIWQTVYSEIYFSDVLWPDFDAVEVDKALSFFDTKQRRFGS
jgi:undecaprenyl diphosphate synthase